MEWEVKSHESTRARIEWARPLAVNFTRGLSTKSPTPSQGLRAVTCAAVPYSESLFSLRVKCILVPGLPMSQVPVIRLQYSATARCCCCLPQLSCMVKPTICTPSFCTKTSGFAPSYDKCCPKRPSHQGEHKLHPGSLLRFWQIIERDGCLSSVDQERKACSRPSWRTKRSRSLVIGLIISRVMYTIGRSLKSWKSLLPPTPVIQIQVDAASLLICSHATLSCTPRISIM